MIGGGGRTVLALAAVLLCLGCQRSASMDADTSARSEALYLDDSAGHDWPGAGRTYGEQHFSPLTEINGETVSQLGLAWSLDLDTGNSVTQPIAVDGKLYFVTARAFSTLSTP